MSAFGSVASPSGVSMIIDFLRSAIQGPLGRK
jgi:hypothetical protein